MTAKKLSELAALTTPTSDDILYIVDDVAVDPISKKITYGNLFKDTVSNSVFANTFTANIQFSAGSSGTNSTITTTSIRVSTATQNAAISATSIRIGNSSVNTAITGNSIATPSFRISNVTTAPANNATATEGEVRITTSAIYVAVANNTWKRVLLTDYS